MSAVARRPFAARPGAATLEFAVVIPALFLMIFGLIEIGRGFMVCHLLENAARTGCRSAVVSGATNASVEAQGEWVVIVLTNFDPPTGQQIGVALAEALNR